MGIDIVKSVIDKNHHQLFGNSHIQFLHGNVAEMDLPSADLFICKDVLMHLPIAAIESIISQFYKYKYCLVTIELIPLI